MGHLYSALLCIIVHSKHFIIIWGGGSLLNHHHTGGHLDDAMAAKGRHTPARGGEERES